MKFSIVITTCNRLFLLKRAINFALSQTNDCEVIVVDNGSTDGTENYLQQLETEGRIISHRNQTNLGHSAAINLGVELAQGDWIKPLDDDDYLAPDCIERFSAAIQTYPQAVIASCQAAQISLEQTEIAHTRRVGRNSIYAVSQENIHYGMLLERLPFGTTSQVAFSKQAFLKSGGWDLNLDICDEIDFWLRVSQFGDAIFINSCLAYRTVWPGGYNHKNSLEKRFLANCLIKEKIYKLVGDRHRSSLPSLPTIYNYLKLHWLIVAIKEKAINPHLLLFTNAVFSSSAWRLLLIIAIIRLEDYLPIASSKTIECIAPKNQSCQISKSNTSLSEASI